MDWSLLALESLVMAIHHFKMKTKASLMVQWLSICLTMQEGFPGGASGQESACNAADMGSTPGSGRSPGGGHGDPVQSSCLENPHGQRSMVGYSLQNCKESDTTEATWPITVAWFYSWSGKTSHAMEQLSPSILELTTPNH